MEWFKRYPQNLATIDPYLADLDLPVQLFWGDLDQFLLVDTAHRVHARLQHSKLTVFENCGHFPFHDKRDAFAGMIADWVETGHLALEGEPG